MIDLISQDKTLLALANLVAAVTAIYAVIQTIFAGIRFFRTLRHSKIYSWYKIFLVMYLKTCYQKALDLHFFISYLILRLINIIGAIILLSTSALGRARILTVDEFDKSVRLKMIWGDYQRYTASRGLFEIADIIVQIILFIVLSLLIFELLTTVLLVKRFRYRWYARRKLPWTM